MSCVKEAPKMPHNFIKIIIIYVYSQQKMRYNVSNIYCVTNHSERRNGNGNNKAYNICGCIGMYAFIADCRSAG